MALTNQCETRQPPGGSARGWEGVCDLAGAVRTVAGERACAASVVEAEARAAPRAKRQRGSKRK